MPGEDIGLYQDLLAEEKNPIGDGTVYDRLHEQVGDHTLRNEAESRAFIEQLRRGRDRTDNTLRREA